MPRRWLAPLGAVFLVLALLQANGSSVAASPAVQQSVPARATTGPPPPTAITARAAVLIDASTGVVLYEKNSHESLPPASLTKMVTATVAIERGDPRQKVVASLNSMVEPTVIGLEPGDVLPLSDILSGLMLSSGNETGDAARCRSSPLDLTRCA